VAAREVVQLYALAEREGGKRGGDGPHGGGRGGTAPLARKDEVKEVLVNLLENARNAGARTVTVRVSDGGLRLDVETTGAGSRPRACRASSSPRFSTTSKRLRLGLAIAKRLVESWGGAITLTSQPVEEPPSPSPSGTRRSDGRHDRMGRRGSNLL